jgi:PilZ domain
VTQRPSGDRASDEMLDAVVGLPMAATEGCEALVEFDRETPPLTGTTGVRDGRLAVAVTPPRPVIEPGTPVTASIYTPAALYQVRATMAPGEGSIVTLSPIEWVTVVQRRKWIRADCTFAVTLSALDGFEADFTGVPGVAIDIGVGGLRVETARRLPPGANPTVIVIMPDGHQLVAETHVAHAEIGVERCHYGLAFDGLRGDDAARISSYVGAATRPG